MFGKAKSTTVNAAELVLSLEECSACVQYLENGEYAVGRVAQYHNHDDDDDDVCDVLLLRAADNITDRTHFRATERHLPHVITHSATCLATRNMEATCGVRADIEAASGGGGQVLSPSQILNC